MRGQIHGESLTGCLLLADPTSKAVRLEGGKALHFGDGAGILVDATQSDVYKACAGRQMVQEAFGKGTSSCVLVMGSKGSGKTHTMVGGLREFAAQGIVPRLAFDMLSQVSVQWFVR